MTNDILNVPRKWYSLWSRLFYSMYNACLAQGKSYIKGRPHLINKEIFKIKKKYQYSERKQIIVQMCV